MPRLWTHTVESHRQEVREAVLDAADELIQSRGLLGVTMSSLAEAAGIGRATVYKYFADVEQVLHAWHDRQIAAHLAQLSTIADQSGPPAVRLRSVLTAYGQIRRQHGHHEPNVLAPALHQPQGTETPHQQLRKLLAELLAQCHATGDVRDDVPLEELANYCQHALDAATGLTTAAAVDRLVNLVWTGLQR